MRLGSVFRTITSDGVSRNDGAAARIVDDDGPFFGGKDGWEFIEVEEKASSSIGRYRIAVLTPLAVSSLLASE
jgi:hypothetical protein